MSADAAAATTVVKEVALYDEEEEYVSAECEAALQEVFARFDVDKDGALNAEELEAFAMATNGEPFSEDTLQEIKDYFKCNDKDQLTLAGFLEMYTLQTSAEPEETWKDLGKLGYDRQLKRVKDE